jgi:capsular polysaccharide export protein
MAEPLASDDDRPEAAAFATALQTVVTFSRKLSRTANVAAMLGAERVIWLPVGVPLPPVLAGRIDAVVGWGEKANTGRARRFAARHHLPYIRIEDGFLRSVGLGVSGEPPLSIAVDDQGIYYDARSPSRLESILAGPDRIDPALLSRARSLMARIREARLSKYNAGTTCPPSLGPRDRRRVLVVDQTAGDLSITCGLADRSTFADMLAAARAENPGAEIVVKTHPDVLAGKKRGYLERPAGVTLLADPIQPGDLFEQIDAVYTVSSQMGFEALLFDRPVTCFGAPFYAGWGLTDDRGPAIVRRARERGLAEVFAAAYLMYCRYVDPETGGAGTAEDVVEHLALQRRELARDRGRIFAFGFRPWKHNVVRAFLRSPDAEVIFCRSADEAERRGFDRQCRLITWGQRGGDEAEALGRRHGVDRWRMEDGFLRSVGLGSDLTAPASLVVDRAGIYYDPRGPSDLETILETAEFSDAELARAAAIRRRMIETRISKYNVGEHRRLDLGAGDREVIMVPGQVEDDASIQLGCVDVKTNAGLLEAARAAAPDAFILFKPHPDVVSGNRRGAVSEAVTRRFADRVEDDVSLAECLAASDAIHTMTSLVGFEGLLREMPVVVHGQPFYAGWGLTQDRHSVARRTRRLTIDQLVAGALIRYPRYLHPVTRRFSTPEATLDRLAAARASGAGPLKISWARRQARKLAHIARELGRAR